MEVITAKAIINAAGVDMPDTDLDKLRAADKLVSDAREAWDQGMHGDPVREIIALVEADTAFDSPINAPSDADIGETKTTRSLVDALQEAGFSIPAVPNFERPFPDDLVNQSDAMLRSLASSFTHYLAYAQWRLGVEESDAQVAERMVDKARREAWLALDKLDPATGKNKLAAHLDAEVGSAPEVLKWEDLLTKHEASVRLLKAQRDINQGYLDRISREMTVRQHEFERSVS